jgi:hypothetical protein
MKNRLLLTFCMLASCVVSVCFVSGNAQAATPVYDFEQDAEIAAWKSHMPCAKLERSNQFATAGQSAMRFTTPTWKQGMPEWPAFETKPAVSDWTPYDRLVIDITNLNEGTHVFSLYVSDSKVPFRKGLSYNFALPSRGYRRFEIPLSALPKEVDRKDIAIMHLFTERPKSDVALVLDNITLLKAGESLPDPDAKFVQQLAGLTLDAIQSVEQLAAKGREPAQAIGSNAKLQERVQKDFGRIDAQLKTLREKVTSPDLTLAQWDVLSNKELIALPGAIDRAVSILRFMKAYGETGLSATDMLVGTATSMEKVLPREALIPLTAAKNVELSLARNEKESVQIGVLPTDKGLKKVSVTVDDLTTADGKVFKHENIDCDVVGYVETKQRPPYGSSYVGYWPDPILKGLGPVDIASDDLQTFWIRVRAPKDQPAGVYRGTLRVSAEGATPVTLAFNVQVRQFTMPDHSPLPMAITFAPGDNVLPETEKEQAEWRKSEEYPVKAWAKHKTEWADFLADYYISYDNLYHSGMPDFEVLTHLHQQNRLGQFNLGYYGHVGSHPVDLENWKAATLPRFRQAYAKAKELGLLDHAYIYGCDEAVVDLFPYVEQAAAALKAEFPDVPVMTTTYDQTYGMDSPIKSMNWFCPLTPSFDHEKAVKARAAGKQVWWYICCGPQHPYANMFIEYPAIEGRLLMGAMTAKQRPDGFLYYEISIWNSQKPITSGPFTHWDPRSWTTYNGDGSWTCVGADGTPLPTIRLENFRDGLEDYAYVLMLEKIVRQQEAKGDSLTAEAKQWLTEAQEALKVPQTLVQSMTEYSRDPGTLYTWRNHITDLIEQSGCEVAIP